VYRSYASNGNGWLGKDPNLNPRIVDGASIILTKMMSTQVSNPYASFRGPVVKQHNRQTCKVL
jgi:hypothetical protein